MEKREKRKNSKKKKEKGRKSPYRSPISIEKRWHKNGGRALKIEIDKKQRKMIRRHR